ncbi:M20 family metallopeptidase [Terracidiphilus gabretensis]|uniref:M20 family metallopeptidase n=1 Tax=Terracidiphilus gabretensis TaxID=1577687 RepID=UPI001E38930C|nr:M20 family metallopeptidase [Terracidiphilus gabretensis]
MSTPSQPAIVPEISMRALLAGARRKETQLLSLAEKLVRAESPSDTKSAVDACGQLAITHARNLGGRVKVHKQRAHGDVLELRFGPKGKSPEGRTLLLSHIDTVWPIGTIQSMPCKIAPDSAGQPRLWGPGTLDMKVGVAMAFTAIEMLIEADLQNREIILLLNTDEEIGSPVSRPITEKLAAESSAVYVLEPAQNLPQGEAAYKTARKGTGNWRIEVTGIAAHAGVDFEKGANALVELARIIQTINSWTELARGLTVSVNVAAAGNKTNVIPATAWAEVDVRLARKADGPRIARKFASLKTSFKTMDKRCKLTITGGVNRPPMERTRGTVALYKQARALAADLGFELAEASTGGASDGNFTSTIGIPTLDGMGAVGDGAHASHESVLIAPLAPRTALIAAMLAAASKKSKS